MTKPKIYKSTKELVDDETWKKENIVKIVVVKKDGRFVDVKLPPEMIADVSQAFHVMGEEAWENFKQNKIDKNVGKFSDIMEFIIHDVIHEGKFYRRTGRGDEWAEDRKGFIIKKPKWKKFPRRI